MKNDVTVWIAGEAGDGIASTGDILIKLAARAGLGAFAHNSYQSVIRGGHVLLQACVGTYPVLSHGERWDVLIALDQNSLHLHSRSARPGAIALFNADKLNPPEGAAAVEFLGVPVGGLTAASGGTPVMQNTVLLGAAVQLLGLPWEIFEEAITAIFGKKKAEVAELNLKAAQAGREYAREHFSTGVATQLRGDGRRRMAITGNQAFGLGALAGGSKFYAAYPMTPASSIMHWLAPRAERYGMLMKQTEDELAAMNMAVGAGFAGARPMVGTSGGGFALMTEALGMAGMVEAPVVAVLAQRGGPSTGLPTKTEQGDLFQALGASQGEFPKAILAPLDPADAYAAAVESLNLADAFQMPVLLLSDLYLSEHVEIVDPERFEGAVSIDRGALLSEAGEDYRRYADTPSGVSPRILPGTPDGMFIASTDEHDERGMLVSDVFTNPTTRVKMMNKRMRKMNGVMDTLAPNAIRVEGPEDAGLTLVGWGSTYSILKEARLRLEAEGMRVRHVQFRLLWPFPAAQAIEMLKTAKNPVCVENNYGGLFARLLRQESGLAFPRSIRKYDGEPFAIDQLVEAVRASRSPDAPAVQVLATPELDIPMVHK